MTTAPKKSTTTASKRQRTIHTVAIDSIKPSPENDQIYGAVKRDDELIDLATDIARAGILEPIVTTKDLFLVSGHRRYHAAKLAKLSHVPTIRLPNKRSDFSDVEFKRELRRYNHQRNKNTAQRIKEKLLEADPNIAHQQLIASRLERDQQAPAPIQIQGVKVRSSISAGKQAMLNSIIGIVDRLRDYWPLTVRQIHYQLLNDPPLRHSSKPHSRYVNNKKSYKDLCDVATRARLLDEIPFEAISDETRPSSCLSFQRDAAGFIDNQVYNLFRGYRRDLMQSQLDHVELVAEKLTVQNIIQPIAKKYCLPLTIGRGYCSIEPRYQLAQRYRQSGKDRLILMIASDHDPDGMEICDSFIRSMRDDFEIENIIGHKVLLTSDQVRQWSLPPNYMKAKASSPNYEKFVERFGDDVYELEAVAPQLMQSAISEAIESVIDLASFNTEIAAEREDAALLQTYKNEIVENLQEFEE